MLLKKYQSLNKNLIKEIEDFLIVADSALNPLFSSPIWAKRLKKIIKFEYTYLIVRDSNKIIALKLIFDGYRGYQKVEKFPLIIKIVSIYFCKLFFGYSIWYNSIVYKKNVSENNKSLIKNIIYDQVKNYKNIYRSPVSKDDLEFFYGYKNFMWATYVIDLSKNSYEIIFSKYKRNAKRSINKTHSIKIKEINKFNLDYYLQWLKINQSTTGKSYKIDKNSYLFDLTNFSKKNYIYKIFIACEGKKILGSISIWGFNNYISERGVNRSKFSKINKYFEQDILKDWIIKYSIKNKIHYFDLGGFNPNNQISTKDESIKKFKEKFGGKVYSYQNINAL